MTIISKDYIINYIRKEAQPLIDEKTLIDKLSRPIRVKLNELFKVTCESLKAKCSLKQKRKREDLNYILEIAGRKTSWAYCRIARVNSFL